MIHWDPLFPVIPSIAVTAVVLMVLIALELRRRLKLRAVRVVCQVLLVATVLLLSLRPSIATQSKGASVLLITDGASEAVVDSLRKSNPSLTSKQITSFNDVSDLNVSVIVGQGLPVWAIDLMPEKKYTFIPSENTEGITGIELADHVYAHRWNEFTGTYNLTGATTTLRLRGPGGMEDSVQLKGPGNVTFTLSFFAKAPGRFNYDFISPAGSETLPVVIEPERNLNILFIADYPTFEVRYLKNFLASKGHRLSIRNQVSRGRYKLEFANRPAMNFQTLSTAVLNSSDLLVIDESSWQTLGSGEQKNLRAAVQSGLGVIVIPQSQSQPRRGSHLISFSATQQKDTARVSLNRAGSFLLPALPIEVKQSTALLTANDRVFSGYIHSGAGKIGYQLLHETYQVGLQEKPEAYSSIWVPLLEKCARSEKQDFKLKITSPFPVYDNQPIEFDVVSSGKEPHVRSAGTDIPLAEDAYIDDLWHGRVWLEGTTWHDLTVDSISTWIHLAKKDSWKVLSGVNNRKATALSATMDSTSTSMQTSYDDRVVRFTLFTLFILAAGFLWLAPKL